MVLWSALTPLSDRVSSAPVGLLGVTGVTGVTVVAAGVLFWLAASAAAPTPAKPKAPHKGPKAAPTTAMAAPAPETSAPPSACVTAVALSRSKGIRPGSVGSSVRYS